MSIETAPRFRVGTVLTRLHRERNYQPASTAAEFLADALLAELARVVAVHGAEPTRALIAEAVEHADRLAHEQAQARVCACGHPFTDHVAFRGCFECACTVRRPHATETAPTTEGGTA